MTQRSGRPVTWIVAACLLAISPPLASVPEEVAGERFDALLVEAGRALEAEQLEVAEDRFERARDLAPEAALPWLGLTEVRERRGDLVAALETARRAESLEPEHPAAVLAVARLLARMGLASEALDKLAGLRELAPDEPRAYLLAAMLLRDLGRTDEALAILERARERSMDQPELIEELALQRLEAGQAVSAAELAEPAARRHPERPGLALAVGLALASDAKRRDEAAAWLERALELGVSDPGRVHLELATLLLDAGREGDALEHLEEAAKLQPDSAEVHYRLGSARRSTGDLEGARVALERFRELESNQDAEERREMEAGTALNRAQTLASQNRLPEALEAVESLLRERPGDDRARALEAKVLFSLGRKDEALASIVEARTRAPGRVEFHYLEGMFLISLERLAEAEAALRRALAIDPELGDAYRLLGALAGEQGRHEEAARFFARALELGVDGAALRLAYARVLAYLGRHEESEEQMRAYERFQEGEAER